MSTTSIEEGKAALLYALTMNRFEYEAMVAQLAEYINVNDWCYMLDNNTDRREFCRVFIGELLKPKVDE